MRFGTATDGDLQDVRGMDRVHVIQDEIADAIVNALRPRRHLEFGYHFRQASIIRTGSGKDLAMRTLRLTLTAALLRVSRRALHRFKKRSSARAAGGTAHRGARWRRP